METVRARQKSVVFFILSVLLIGLAAVGTAGCSSSAEIAATAERQANTADVPQEPTSDFSAYSNNKAYQPVIETLKQNMHAWADHDKTAFESTFIDRTAFENHLFLLDDQDHIRFAGKPVLTEREAGRIDVNVEYEIRSAASGEVKKKGATYNLEQNADGEWKVVQID